MNKRCTNKRCSQHIELTHTGYGANQGCTYYCLLCGWGYWEHKIKPTDAELTMAKAIYPKAVVADLTYTVLKPIPPKPYTSSKTEDMMIDFFGGRKRPYWLNEKQKAVWRQKYIKKYPEGEFAKAEAKAEDGGYYV